MLRMKYDEPCGEGHHPHQMICDHPACDHPDDEHVTICCLCSQDWPCNQQDAP